MPVCRVSSLASLASLASSLFSFPCRRLRQLVLASVSGWLLGGAVLVQADHGALMQLECINEEFGNAIGCTDGRGLGGASSVTVSPDGKHVYVAAAGSRAVAVLERDKQTGALMQLAGSAGCISDLGDGVLCARGKGLLNAVSVIVSPDGKHVYVAATDAFGAVGIAALRRDETGALSQSAGLDGCISETGGGGICTEGKGLLYVNSVAVSPDGKHVYVAAFSSNAVAAFARNKQTGVLTQLAGLEGCISDTGSSGACTDGTGLNGARSVTVSKDGKHVYVVSYDNNSGGTFIREK